VVLMSIPFVLLFTRAAVRSGWAMMAKQGDPATATVGLLRPWIIFSPHLAKRLRDRQIEAALAHERAHARHRDPLRIWLAQLATDLQWPWPQAGERLGQWLAALELARDEEARAAGVDGTDLAETILASARFTGQTNLAIQTALVGDPSRLKERITRLLDPLIEASDETIRGSRVLPWLLPLSLLLALAVGSVFGGCVIDALLGIAA
jgi:beta-lactamase regulating signal transducer with metallopeptidase domain